MKMIVFYAIHPGFVQMLNTHHDLLKEILQLERKQKDQILQEISKKEIRDSALSFFDVPVYEEHDRLLLKMDGNNTCCLEVREGAVRMDSPKNPFLELLKRKYPCYILEVVK